MSSKKSELDASSMTLLRFADARKDKPMEAEELLNEIDNLALLLHEVRKQTDKIEAAADAIGDAILTRLGTERPGPEAAYPQVEAIDLANRIEDVRSSKVAKSAWGRSR